MMKSMVDIFCILYENRMMKSKGGRGGKKDNDGGVNLIKIYYKHICKYHNTAPCTTIICHLK
jgi:hypothetical protein